MIALYLIAVKKYKIQEAVELLKERHSYARPSPLVIEEALHMFESPHLKQKIVAWINLNDLFFLIWNNCHIIYISHYKIHIIDCLVFIKPGKCWFL